MTWLSIWSALKRVPLLVYVATALLAAGAVHLHQDTVAVREAYTKGRTDVVKGAKFDSSLVSLVVKAKEAAVKRTDSTRTVVRWRVARVDSQAIIAAALARQLPPSIDTLPAVIKLRAAVFTLETSVQQLRVDMRADSVAFDAERAANKLAEGVIVSQLTQARLETAREHDGRVLAEKRPTKLKAIAGAVVSVALVETARVIVRAVRR